MRKENALSKAVHLLVVALIATGAGGCLITSFSGDHYRAIPALVLLISVMAFLALLFLTLALVLTSHPHRHLAFTGMLVTFLLLIMGFGLPRITG